MARCFLYLVKYVFGLAYFEIDFFASFLKKLSRESDYYPKQSVAKMQEGA